MQLARHSDPKLTMARYGRAQLHDLAGAVEGLPNLLPATGPAGGVLAATGTDQEFPTSEVRADTRLHQDSASRGQPVMTAEGGTGIGPPATAFEQSRQLSAVANG